MNNFDNVMSEFNSAMSKSTKRIYTIEVSSKLTGKHALYFYVRAFCMADAVVYAENYLVPEALVMTQAILCKIEESEIYSDVFDADQVVPVWLKDRKQQVRYFAYIVITAVTLRQTSLSLPNEKQFVTFTGTVITNIKLSVLI